MAKLTQVRTFDTLRFGSFQFQFNCIRNCCLRVISALLLFFSLSSSNHFCILLCFILKFNSCSSHHIYTFRNEFGSQFFCSSFLFLVKIVVVAFCYFLYVRVCVCVYRIMVFEIFSFLSSLFGLNWLIIHWRFWMEMIPCCWKAWLKFRMISHIKQQHQRQHQQHNSKEKNRIKCNNIIVIFFHFFSSRLLSSFSARTINTKFGPLTKFQPKT